MGSAFIAFVACAAVAGWLYGKFVRTNGDNTKSSAAIAGITAVVVCILIFGLLWALNTN